MEKEREENAGPTTELRGLKSGDPQAIERLWGDYFHRLVGLARTMLPQSARRDADEEDVALSAFQSLCKGAAAGQYPKLDDRDGLWRLLVVITLRKARRARRRGQTLKRGGAQVKGTSAYLPAGKPESDPSLAEILSEGPTPAFAAEVAEQCERLLDRLGDDDLRSIAIMKMEGYTVGEIAQKLSWATRSVERGLQSIRAKWSTALSQPE